MTIWLKTTGKSIASFLACLLLLSTLAVPARACYCEGGCPNCESCVDCYCECTSECGCDGKSCSGCCECVNCSCEPNDSKCDAYYTCISCACICTGTPYYTQDTVITTPTITSPGDGDSVCVTTPQLTLTCTTATDSDTYHRCVGNTWTVGPVSDNTITHTWSAKWAGTANNAGTFPSGNTGTSVAWDPPSSSGEVTIEVVADDDGTKYNDSPSSHSITIKVVKVDKLQYNDPDSGYTDCYQFPLYVRKGTTVTFKAIPDPSGASWPSGKPVWGGTSGASGTGETTAVTFNTLSSSLTDYKTVTATCGNTLTADIVVFDFEGVFTPKDDFDGRHTMYYGIEEKVELSFETDPWSVTAGQAGGLEWTKGSGPGTVSDAGTDGTADYDAGATDGTVWLILTIKSGPSKDSWEGYQKNIILPSGTRMTRVNPNTVWHIQGYASAGIALYYWLDPKYVSFKYLTFGEDSCPSTNVSEFYLTCEPWLPLPAPTNSYPNGTQQAGHTQNTFGAILGGNDTTGCRVSVWDEASSGAADPYAAGSFTWSIPTQYIDDTSTRNTFGSNQDQVSTFQANGDATQAKGGQPPGSAALNDPNSGF